ncbi:CPBP family intramembrane glutamic endopeptidase [Paracoccaceae bacterium GXU_MW_L88]
MTPNTRPSLLGIILGFVLICAGFVGGLAGAAMILRHVGRGFSLEQLSLLTIAGPFVAALAVALIVMAVQGRPLRAVIGPLDVKNYLLGTLAAIALGFVGIALAHLFSSPIVHHDIPGWLALIPIAIPVIFIQTLTEELVFRGWLQSSLIARFGKQWVGLVIPSLIFGLAHYQGTPAFGLSYVGLTFLMGMIAGIITLRTGSIWAASGVHFGNNIYALLLLGLDNPMGRFQYWTLPVNVDDYASVGPWFGAEAIVILAAFALWLTRAPEQPPRALTKA